MFKYSKMALTLSLFWLPSTPANPGSARLGLKRVATIAVATGAGVFGFTRNERNTSRILKKIQETAETTSEWFSEKLSDQKDWLSEKFGEQKDEHSLMLKTLAKLDKQNDTLEKQNKVLKRQNALILSKVYDLETIVSRVNQRMQGHQTSPNEALDLETPDFLTSENEANEDPLTRRGVIVMETDEN